ncbi:MAG: ATP-binding cassette domain-containing protein [Gemmatimonadetes bacterium]|nr:ATP-binding cassette domain-containing protein [Gemmatimonadota bacterium]NIR79869.1 ATP-binding cassette domain-containing protein [Gemmatimonadota bacterium]NIT88590.1 ATP-binding cassette domain-containing protein [Gemmatimonadota bacterium]NIU32409.1 ATP-binding cassette domain-containing protein [Gemmatimonadota bacterium]NIU36909.1 ATP-binding cassette domain-containing protein [Gemmatimonadota bacterium]
MATDRLTPARTLGFLRRLGPRVRPHLRELGWAAVLLLVSTAIGLAFPLVVRELLDAAFLAGDRGLLDRIAVGLVILFAFQAVANFGQSYLTAAASERVVADLRRDLFGHLVHQPPGFYAQRRVGELSSRIASDAGLVQGVLRFGVPELIRQGLFLVGALVLVTITHPRLTLVTLVAIPFAAVVGWLFGRRVRFISTGIQDRLASAVSRAEQVFTQIRTVQSFTREEDERRRFDAEVEGVRDEGLKRAVARAALTGAVTFAAFGAIVLVLWEGGRLVLAGELTPGTLVAFLLYAVTIAGAITSLAGFWNNLQEAAGAARRIFELLDHPRELEEPERPLPLPRPVRGVVRYEGVTFRYEPGLPLVLEGVDVTLDRGETVALVGSSGVGKSTMASLIPRFYDVEEGRVTLDGVDVRRLALRELRSVVGLVPQEPMLFAGSVRENLLYGRPDAGGEELRAAAVDAHAHEFVREFPNGYDQLVGERGVTLSAGQRQRIAIARVMLKRPAVLILDEASSSLDAESETLVQDALDRLMRGRTTLVIAHRLSTVLRAARILVLEGGVVRDRGTHSELLERSEVYQRLYQRQFEDALATTRTATP